MLKLHGAVPLLPHTPAWRGAELSTGTILLLSAQYCIVYLRSFLSHRKGSVVSCQPAVSQFEQDGAFSSLNKDRITKTPDFLCYTVASLTAYKRCGT